MTTTTKLEGSMTALVTPFKGGQVDEAAFVAHVERQIEEGTQCLVPCGTTGEATTLSTEEHLRVVSLAVKTAGGRVPVIAGSGKNDTAATISMTKAIAEAGAGIALVVTPYYNKPTQEGLFRHFTAVADASPIPVLLYNVPGRTGVNMLPETVARLAKHPKIIGTKEASGDLVQAAEIVRSCGPDFALISGEDPLTFPMIALGARGVISVVSNVVPGEFARMVAASRKGDVPAARAIHLKLLPLMRGLFLESSPGPVKYALERLGRMTGELRLPLVPPSDPTKQKVDALLKELSLL